MRPFIYLGVVVWLGCGVLASGFYRTAFYQDGESCAGSSAAEERREQATSILLIPAGAPYLVAALMVSGFGYTGWSLAPRLCVQDWRR